MQMKETTKVKGMPQRKNDLFYTYRRFANANRGGGPNSGGAKLSLAARKGKGEDSNSELIGDTTVSTHSHPTHLLSIAHTFTP